MKEKELVNYVRNHTKKEQEEFVSNDEIVDFKDGTTFSWQEVEEYKEEYDKISDDIDIDFKEFILEKIGE